MPTTVYFFWGNRVSTETTVQFKAETKTIDDAVQLKVEQILEQRKLVDELKAEEARKLHWDERRKPLGL